MASCVRNTEYKVKVKFTLERATKAYRYGSSLSLTSALDGGGGVVNATPRPLYPREINGTHCVEGWVGPMAGLEGCRKPRPPTEIRSPDRPARDESLYRLSYPSPHLNTQLHKKKYLKFIFIILNSCDFERLLRHFTISHHSAAARCKPLCRHLNLPLHVSQFVSHTNGVFICVVYLLTTRFRFLTVVPSRSHATPQKGI
jgi:hypothetical protein